jgi:hypothetical protein
VIGGVAGFAVGRPAPLSNKTTSFLYFHAITFNPVFDAREKRVLMTVLLWLEFQMRIVYFREVKYKLQKNSNICHPRLENQNKVEGQEYSLPLEKKLNVNTVSTSFNDDAW